MKILDVYSLSPVQSGLLFNYLSLKSDEYLVQQIFHTKALDVDVLKSAWHETIKKYEILRTGFSEKGTVGPIQYIVDDIEVPIVEYDFSKISNFEQKLEKFILNDRFLPFDMAHPPLFRISVIKHNFNNFVMIFTFHHILLDGWSSSILLDSLFYTYNKLLEGKTIEPNSISLPFKRYIEYISSVNFNCMKNFWKKYLHDADILVLQKNENIVENFEHTEMPLVFSFEETAKLHKVCNYHEITTNVLLLGALGLALKTYSRKTNNVIGIVTSGRNIDLEKIESMVGMLVCTLPLKITIKNDVSEYLHSIQMDMLAIAENGLLPLVEIQKLKGYDRQLFDILFAFENYPVSVANDYIISSKSIEKTEYPLTIVAYIDDEKLNIIFRYKQNYLNDYEVALLQNLFKKALLSMCECTDTRKIFEISQNYLRKKHYEDFKSRSITEEFVQRLDKYADSIAVNIGDKHITYSELDRESNRVANLLHSKDVKTDEIIGIYTGKSIETIIGITGILKAGCAYLPIDPTYPPDRIKYMLNDSKANIVLDMNILNLSEQTPSYNCVKISPDNLAYVIYTSGSTGKPKGVQISHRNVLNLLFSTDKNFDFRSNDTWSLFHNISFDFAVWECFGALLHSAKLVIANEDQIRDSRKFEKFIDKNLITIVNQTPEVFYNLSWNKCVDSIRYVILGGDKLDFQQIAPWINKNKIINMYGITETTVHVTYFEVKKVEEKSNVGKELTNYCLYILDENLNLLPDGIKGEIHVGGMGLARGYLNRPDLTAEKFIANPFGDGDRLYKTGDLGRYLPDGNIEFLRRIDNQVKIRGFRIELEEIETAINNCENVKNSVVLVDNSRLIACIVIVTEESSKLIENVKSKIEQKLPRHMIPNQFVIVTEIPLTSNGKIDFHKLKNSLPQISLSQSYVAPITLTEKILHDVWTEVLQVKNISIDDNFFQLGGDSIKVIRCAVKFNNISGKDISVSDILNNLTIRKVALHIENKKHIQQSNEYKKFSLVKKSIFESKDKV